MKRIQKIEPSINPATVKDGRGIIQPFWPKDKNIVEWNYIVTLKGCIRGHHYHNEFDEYVMFVEGEGVYTEYTNDKEEVTTVSAGTCLYIPSGVPHTFYPTADCKMIAMITKRWDDCKEPITKFKIK